MSRRCSECGSEITGRLDRQTCSARCRVTRSRRLQPAPLNTEVTIVGDGTGTALLPVRVWVWVKAPSERESAFTRVRHVLTESDPYSGFGRTACGRDARNPFHDRTDEDIRQAQEQDGIPPDLCPKCDRATA